MMKKVLMIVGLGFVISFVTASDNLTLYKKINDLFTAAEVGDRKEYDKPSVEKFIRQLFLLKDIDTAKKITELFIKEFDIIKKKFKLPIDPLMSSSLQESGIVAKFIGMAVRSFYSVPESYKNSDHFPSKQYFLQFLDMLFEVSGTNYCLLYNSYKDMKKRQRDSGEAIGDCTRCERNVLYLGKKILNMEYEHSTIYRAFPKHDIIEDHLLKRCSYAKFLAHIALRNPLRSLFTLLLLGGIGFWVGKKKGWFFKKLQ